MARIKGPTEKQPSIFYSAVNKFKANLPSLTKHSLNSRNVDYTGRNASVIFSNSPELNSPEQTAKIRSILKLRNVLPSIRFARNPVRNPGVYSPQTQNDASQAKHSTAASPKIVTSAEYAAKLNEMKIITDNAKEKIDNIISNSDFYNKYQNSISKIDKLRSIDRLGSIFGNTDMTKRDFFKKIDEKIEEMGTEMNKSLVERPKHIKIIFDTEFNRVYDTKADLLLKLREIQKDKNSLNLSNSVYECITKLNSTYTDAVYKIDDYEKYVDKIKNIIKDDLFDAEVEIIKKNIENNFTSVRDSHEKFMNAHEKFIKLLNKGKLGEAEKYFNLAADIIRLNNSKELNKGNIN